jgi:hypothetical protein
MDASAHRIGRLFSRFPTLEVATYQRTFVWHPGQKASFIRSILSDYPTGLIVLNKTARSGLSSIMPNPPAHTFKTVHEVIDGQQRLSTLDEFLANPMVYVTEWQKVLRSNAVGEEPPDLLSMRNEYQSLWPRLAKPKSGFVVKGTPRSEVKSKVADRARVLFPKWKRGGRLTGPDADFVPLLQAIDRASRGVEREYIAIAELHNIDAENAERIYQAINTTGTALTWWQLLAVKDYYNSRFYPSTAGYSTKNDTEVRTIADLYKIPTRLKQQLSTGDTLWHAIHAVGEKFQFAFSGGSGPINATNLPAASDRRLNVDGLGFRLVSGFLTHDIGLTTVTKLPQYYDDEEIRQAVDALFDAVEYLFGSHGAASNGYALFEKYSRFKVDALPAYPVLGMFIAAAKLIALNRAKGAARGLSKRDCLSIRSLTEELLRQAICSSKWVGSGDSKLKAWLDDHFDPVGGNSPKTPGRPFPGKLRNALNSYDHLVWADYVEGLGATGKPSVDKNSMGLLFWIQYLFDSVSPGCLPAGHVQFDHIVAHDASPGSQTSNPLNYAAISGRINDEKKRKTFSNWQPSTPDLTEYRLCSLDNPTLRPGLPNCPGLGFLRYADHANLDQMIDERKAVFAYAVSELIPRWISNGD